MKQRKVAIINQELNGNIIIDDESKWSWREDYQGVNSDFGLMLLMHHKVLGRSHRVGFMSFDELMREAMRVGVDSFKYVFHARLFEHLVF